ncbi:MAG: 5'/3'-nucleotidase SurE [Nitrospira sp.]|nr:5'/3'-nucleotidase SurE [bacterium]MBL7050200.1 5'/3'-nucleotidase SurE [Nitrospira sp.]
MPSILVTNDDGINSPGIRALTKALKSIGDVYVVAPESEQSAVAHALTMHRPLCFEKHSAKHYAVNGTPTDCVILGVHKLMPVRPDIIVSGINNGANLGDDVTYSGTVAAAIEGTLLGIPSVAVSLALGHRRGAGRQEAVNRYREAADIAKEVALMVIEKGLPADTLVNINVPECADIKKMLVTRQGRLSYDNAIKELKDPRGRQYFWIGGGTPKRGPGKDTDIEAVQNGFISVTPVHLDLTNYKAMKFLQEKWKL